jgi:hypothetical protein
MNSSHGYGESSKKLHLIISIMGNLLVLSEKGSLSVSKQDGRKNNEKTNQNLRASMVFHVKFPEGAQVLKNIISICPIMAVGYIRVTVRAIRIGVAFRCTTSRMGKGENQ